MGASVQPLEESTSPVPTTGNEPVTMYLLMRKIMKMKLIMQMKLNLLLPHNNM